MLRRSHFPPVPPCFLCTRLTLNTPGRRTDVLRSSGTIQSYLREANRAAEGDLSEVRANPHAATRGFNHLAALLSRLPCLRKSLSAFSFLPSFSCYSVRRESHNARSTKLRYKWEREFGGGKHQLTVLFHLSSASSFSPLSYRTMFASLSPTRYNRTGVQCLLGFGKASLSNYFAAILTISIASPERLVALFAFALEPQLALSVRQHREHRLRVCAACFNSLHSGTTRSVRSPPAPSIRDGFTAQVTYVREMPVRRPLLWFHFSSLLPAVLTYTYCFLHQSTALRRTRLIKRTASYLDSRPRTARRVRSCEFHLVYF